MRTTSRLVPLLAVSAATLVAAGPISPADAAWGPTQSVPAAATSSGAPRVGVAADGTAVLVDRRKTDVTVATATRTGGFGAFKALTHEALSDPTVAAGPDGAALVAWLGEDRALRVAVRQRTGESFRIRRVSELTGQDISTIAAQHDPLGGWVVALDAFRSTKAGLVLQTVGLGPNGAVTVAPQTLGAGSFGRSARPTATLDITPKGRAVLVADDTTDRAGTVQPPGPGTLVWTSEHGEPFGAPAVLGGTPSEHHVDARVAASDDGRYAVTWTRSTTCGDVLCLGASRVVSTAADGTRGAETSPTQIDRYSFGPSAVPTAGGSTLVAWNQRAAPDAFSASAPVRAATIAADGASGPAQVLDADRKASEPLALPLSGGRAIVVWAGATALRAAVSGKGSTLQVIPGPAGPVPTINHFNETNRDIRSAGPWVAVAWYADGRLRVARGRF